MKLKRLDNSSQFKFKSGLINLIVKNGDKVVILMNKSSVIEQI